MSGEQSPDVILLICDQMQGQRLGLGTPSLTPNLDALAARGARFDCAFCSYAQCTPSRASLQTGLYPHEAGVMVIYGFGGHTGHLGPEHTTIAHAFAAAGYSTALFGKSHFGYPLVELGYRDGIERSVGPSLGEVDRRITDDALAYLADREPDRPMFLVVSWHQPHPPFEDVDEFLEAARAAVTIPESFHDDLSDRPAYQAERRAKRGGGYTEEFLRIEQAQYHSMIAAVDQEVGCVLSAVERRERPRVVAFTSDHGDLIGAHGMRLKGPLPYEELYRVPLIVAAPQVAPGKVVNALNVNVDLPGTLLDLAGVLCPTGWPDRALPGLTDDDAGPDEVFMEHYGAYWGFHPFRIVRTKDRKYVRHYGPGEGEEELYDLELDPHERTNRACDPAYAADRARLRASVDEWWLRTGGLDWDDYESDEFRGRGQDTLLRDNKLWKDDGGLK
jgi:arylsulfatase A-like enzyme